MSIQKEAWVQILSSNFKEDADRLAIKIKSKFPTLEQFLSVDLGGYGGKSSTEVARLIDKNSQTQLNMPRVRQEVQAEGDWWFPSLVDIGGLDFGGVEPTGQEDLSVPIVVGSGGAILDGRHRVALALQRGIQSLPAYLPAEEYYRSLSIGREAWARQISRNSRGEWFDQRNDGTGSDLEILETANDRDSWAEWMLSDIETYEAREAFKKWYAQVPPGKMVVDLAISTGPEDPPARVLRQIRWLKSEVTKVSPVAIFAVAQPNQTRENFIPLDRLVEAYQFLGLQVIARDGNTMLMGAIL